MFAYLGPAPLAQGTDLIARALGGWVLATLGGHGTGTSCRRRQATNRPGKQANASVGLMATTSLTPPLTGTVTLLHEVPLKCSRTAC